MNRMQRGYLVAIGGAEKKGGDALIIDRIVDLAGGDDGHIVVVPTASRRKDTADRYAHIFTSRGIGQVSSLTIQSREDAKGEEVLEQLEAATLVFLTGGKQLRLSTVLGGTRVGDCIRRLYKSGIHVAGTSAGAAFLSEHMIAGGRSGATPTDLSVRLATGLGLTNRLIIDQHFRERDRLGRLLAAVALTPYLIGIGLDEDTAVFLGPTGEFEVVGTGGVTVIDPKDMENSTMGKVETGKPVSLSGLRLHSLAHGARFHTVSNRVTIPS